MNNIKKALALGVAVGGMVVGGASVAAASSSATGSSSSSPGIASGDTIQVPVSVPLNLCGTGLDLIGLTNPVSGSECATA